MKSKVIFLGVLLFGFFYSQVLIQPTVFAGVKCSPKSCYDDCNPKPKGDTKWGNGGPDDYNACCCGCTNCSVHNSCDCGNCSDFRDVPKETPTPTVCSCTETQCPGTDQSKFMQRPTTEGSRYTCASATSCTRGTAACTKYKNTPPSCSILPTSVSMTRESNPKQVDITVNDADYGDTVTVTGVKVVNKFGELNSCVSASVIGGGALLGSTLKPGSDNPSEVSKTTGVLLDPREVHGVFERNPLTGESECSGKLIVEIFDSGVDGPGGPDIGDHVSCTVEVKVTNEAPQLSGLKLTDEDVMSDVRDLGETKNGNLIDGRDQLFVGSILTTQSKARASSCSESLTKTDPILCPGGAEKYDLPYSSRRNPLQLEFTVSDANGRNDIMQAGFWIQNTAQNKDKIAFPLVTATGIRNSFQVLYSEKENIQVVGGDARSYFLSRACIGTSCGPQELSASSKQIFSALAFINDLPTTVPANGNVKVGKKQWITQRNWQKVGFPDCMNLANGCVLANIPAGGQTVATTTDTTYSNYDWAIAAEADQLICFKSDSAVPTVIPASTPVICPVGCSACAKKEGATASTTVPNAITFKFGIYFNDTESGQGMPAGEYALFISALDKVGAPLNNVESRGDEGWVKFNKNGILCSGAACASNSDFVLNYDPIAPGVSSNVTWKAASSSVEADVKISDNTGGSGIAGVSNQFMAFQVIQEGEALDERRWAIAEDGEDFNGKKRLDLKSASTTVVTLKGSGLSPEGGEEVVAGLCAFDNAGNMGCGRNGQQYVFLAPWLKTSYGDIFSAKGSDSSVPFAQSLPNIAGDVTDRSKKVYVPFTEQIYTIGTGLLMTTGNSGVGVTGGYTQDTTQLPIGFAGNYRPVTDRTYNLFGHVPFIQGNEFSRLKSVASLNCDLQNSMSAESCQVGTGLGSIGGKQYNIINMAGGTVATPLQCTGTNVIFVSGALTVSDSVTKTNTGSGCIFVLANTASLTIGDTFSNTRSIPATGFSDPGVDTFDAAIVADSGATIKVAKGVRGTTASGLKSSDRLVINGWVYSANTAPQFERDLIPGDNRRYPAEWIKYDANLLDTFRPLLGVEKTVDLTCGTSSHVLCSTKE